MTAALIIFAASFAALTIAAILGFHEASRMASGNPDHWQED